MKNNTILKFCSAALTISAAATMLFSCAKNTQDTANEQTKEYLEAWIQVHHPNAKVEGNGIYVIEETPGTGRVYNPDSSFVYVEYTTRSLDGTITSTTSKRLSQQIGSYKTMNYYGPRVLSMPDMPVGVEDMIKTMKIGGSKTALIPSYLMTEKRYSKPEDYMKHKTSDASALYTITLHDMFNNNITWEVDSVQRYIDRVHPGLDTTSYGFWFKELREPENTVKFKSDTTVYITYIGRLLNGTVFDTNIADTAKKYAIFDATREYGPSKITWAEKSEDLKISSSESEEAGGVVTGFSSTLWKMGSKSKAKGIFISWYGYGKNSKSAAIPAYSPLSFEIEMVDKPTKD